MQIGHCHTESTVRSTEDVWVANSLLHSNGVASHNRFVVIEGRPCVAVPRVGHVKAVVSIFVIHHDVARHVFLGQVFLALSLHIVR